MSRLLCRGSFVGAAFVVALLASGAADAQVVVAPCTPQQPGGLFHNLITGVQYDIVNQALAERRLEKLQAKLRRDTERGDLDAVGRDARQIEIVKHRIVVDEWLIRKNTLQDPGFYPFPLRTKAASCAAVAGVCRPPQAP